MVCGEAIIHNGVLVQLFPMLQELPEDGENYDCILKTGCHICSSFSQTFIFWDFLDHFWWPFGWWGICRSLVMMIHHDESVIINICPGEKVIVRTPEKGKCQKGVDKPNWLWRVTAGFSLDLDFIRFN